MNKLILLLSLIIFYSCSSSTIKESSNQNDNERIIKTMLSKFKDIRFDTLKVYSPPDIEGEYHGLVLDSNEALLFPKEIYEANFIDPPGLFGIYKFRIDNKLLGLIARTPSEYMPSSIKLFFFDEAKNTIVSYLELAENWGDAGDGYTKDSWLFRGADNHLLSLVWVYESHDNSVDDESDTTIQEWNHYYLLDIMKQRSDTINKDEKFLLKKYYNLLNK
jgi:hypothetical protein